MKGLREGEPLPSNVTQSSGEFSGVEPVINVSQEDKVYAFSPDEWNKVVGEGDVTARDTSVDTSPYRFLSQQVDDVLGSLTSDERGVLQLRFGLRDGKQRSVRQTATELQIPKSTVFDMERRALNKLRHPRPRVREHLT